MPGAQGIWVHGWHGGMGPGRARPACACLCRGHGVTPAPARVDRWVMPLLDRVSKIVPHFSADALIRAVSHQKLVGVMARMPNGLAYQGEKLWKAVTAEFDFVAEPHKERILFDACKIADMIDRLDKEMASEPLTVRGSMGQKAIHPCLAQAQSARGQLAQLLGRLGLPDTDEESQAKADKLSHTRSRAARGNR